MSSISFFIYYGSASMTAGGTTVTVAGAGFTGALNGRVGVISGAGVGGATLVGTISGASGTTFTLSVAASTTVTGAPAVTGTDDTQAFKDAIADAAAAGSGVRTVYVPIGHYLFATAGGIGELPESVQLIGPGRSAVASMGLRNQSGAAYGPHETKPMDGRTACLVIACDEGTTAGRFIHVRSNSCMGGLTMFWPGNANVNLTAPKLYPWAVEMYGSNPRLENMQIQGIYCHVGERHHVRDIIGQPLLTGLYASQLLDTSRFEDVAWHLIQSHMIATGSGTPTGLFNWIIANGTAFKWGRVDNVQVARCHVYGWYRGHYFVNDAAETTTYASGSGAPGGRAWCHFSDCIVDGTVVGLEIDDVSAPSNSGQGVTWTGGNIISSPYGPSPAPTFTYDVIFRSTFTGNFTVTGTHFDGVAAKTTAIHFSGGGILNVNGNNFSERMVNGVEGYGTSLLNLRGNTFLKSGQTIMLNAGEATNQIRGLASGNFFNASAAVAIAYGPNYKFRMGEDNLFADYANWVDLSLSNGWVNYGSPTFPLQVIRRGDFVRVRGVIKSGTSGQVCATLPVGARPPFLAHRMTVTSGGYGQVGISSSGDLIAYVLTGANTYFDIDVTFEVR